MTTWITVCNTCILHGPGQSDCTCKGFEPPGPSPAPAVRLPEPEPTPFARDMMERDRVAEMDNTHGVECRRWSICAWSDCQVVSPEMRTWWEQREWEIDHAAFGCQHIEPATDPDQNPWLNPTLPPFIQCLEPSENAVHITRRASHEFVSSRIPQARAAA